MLLWILTAGLGAYLVFQVQPIIGSVMTPLHGGSAAVWLTCMVCFQVALCAGYGWAHLIRSATPRARRWHIAAWLLGWLQLPVGIHLGALDMMASLPPGIGIPLSLLMGAIIPYIVVSSTSPLVQSWHAAATGKATSWPLAAASNIGSLAALLSYPVLIEPYLGLRAQGWCWTMGYGVWGILVFLVMRRAGQATAPAEPIRQDASASWDRVAIWILLSAAGVAMLMGATASITARMASIPLLWVIPCAGYLVSWILVCAHPAWYHRGVWMPMAAISLLAAAGSLAAGLDGMVGVVVITTSVVMTCVVVHGELIRSASGSLTSFWFISSIGGAMGGIVMAILLPLVTTRIWDAELAIIWSAVAVVVTTIRLATRHQAVVIAGISVILISVVIGAIMHRRHEAIWADRSFYGSLVVVESGDVRKLVNNMTSHGLQRLQSPTEPTSYYGRDSGMGQAMAMVRSRTKRPCAVLVIGVGAGVTAAYAQPGDTWDMVDIDPLAIHAATTYFTFLSDAQQRALASVRTRADHACVVYGDMQPGIRTHVDDGRRFMRHVAPATYDLIVVDAFSGDHVPTHLLTAEAFAQYASAVRDDGLIAVHISNRYTDLRPVVMAGADSIGRTAIRLLSESDDAMGINMADWICVGHRIMPAKPVAYDKRLLWTDDHASVWTLTRF